MGWLTTVLSLSALLLTGQNIYALSISPLNSLTKAKRLRAVAGKGKVGGASKPAIVVYPVGLEALSPSKTKVKATNELVDMKLDTKILTDSPKNHNHSKNKKHNQHHMHHSSASVKAGSVMQASSTMKYDFDCPLRVTEGPQCTPVLTNIESTCQCDPVANCMLTCNCTAQSGSGEITIQNELDLNVCVAEGEQGVTLSATNGVLLCQVQTGENGCNKGAEPVTVGGPWLAGGNITIQKTRFVDPCACSFFLEGTVNGGMMGSTTPFESSMDTRNCGNIQSISVDKNDQGNYAVSCTSAQCTPGGPYMESCSDCKTSENCVLSCECKDEKQEMVETSVDLKICADPAAVNNAQGMLSCELSSECNGGSVGGPFLTDEATKEVDLSAEGCQLKVKIDSGSMFTPNSNSSLDLRTCEDPTQIKIENKQLVCPSKGCTPGGSYTQSCKGCNVDSNACTLSCKCEGQKGQIANTLNMKTCADAQNINNNNGMLSCELATTCTDGGQTGLSISGSFLTSDNTIKSISIGKQECQLEVAMKGKGWFASDINTDADLRTCASESFGVDDGKLACN